MQSKSIKSLVKKYPTGESLFEELFFMILSSMDEKSCPIEGWVKDDWENVENALKDHLDYFRKDYDLKSILRDDLSPAQFKSEKKDAVIVAHH